MPGPDGSDGTQVLGPHGSRLDMAKKVITDKVMPAIPGNKVSVVTYSGGGHLQAPLTDDFEYVRWILENWVTVLTPAAPGGGSHMAEGLKTAVQVFKRAPDQSKDRVLVIFSDGGFDDKVDELDKVLQELVDMKVRVVIVGLGGSTPINIPEYIEAADGTYQFNGWAKKDGKVVPTVYESATLEHVAATTGGELLHLEKESDFAVQWAAKLAGSKAEAHETPVYQYPLAGALLVLIGLSLRGLARRDDVI